MTKDLKNYSSTNNSNADVTSNGTKSVSTHSDALTRYYQNNLLKSAERLFINVDVSLIVDHLSSLMYYATNPECYKDLEKEDVVNIANDQMNILSHLIDIDIHFREYYSHKNESNLK